MIFEGLPLNLVNYVVINTFVFGLCSRFFLEARGWIVTYS